MPRQSKKATKVSRSKVPGLDAKIDVTAVRHKDPNSHYGWERTDDEMGMQLALAKGYTPAIGKEEPVFGGPYKEGKPKIRGTRILMKCPKKDAMARRLHYANMTKSQKQKGKEALMEDVRKARGVRKGPSANLEIIDE